MNSLHVKASDYQRLFRLKGRTFLLPSDIFGGYYRNLDCLLIGVDDTWTSYLPKAIVEKALSDGLDLLSSKEKFSKYVKDFSEYQRSSSDFFENTLKKSVLDKNDAIKFLSLLSEMSRFYSKTEFFYTDRAYMKLEDNPPEDLIMNIEVFEEVKNNGRLYLNQLIFSGGYLDQFVDIISKRFSIPVLELKMYKVDEITELFDAHKVKKSTINARLDLFIQYSSNGIMQYFEGLECKSIVDEFSHNDQVNKKIIKGVSANKGIKRGKIKVIPTDYYSDFSILTKIFDDMDEGDILVAETTSPELMPACKKAGAIITDQGGLLSHAAIVSREMNIPCIVGTGNATEILKDGDMVEVDADNGIIKVIK